VIDLLAVAKMRDARNSNIVIPAKTSPQAKFRGTAKRESSVFFTPLGRPFRGDDANFAAVTPA
jgi:hypothetical protein